MVCDKILGKIGKTDKKIDFVSIEWFERDKKILKKTTENGEEIGIRPDRPLNEGDILYEDENKIIAVEIAESDLIKISVEDIVEMGRLCFEIGNRHLSLAIKPDSVKIPFDEPTFEYLKKLGFKAEKVRERFTDYKECKGHAHTHEPGSHSHTHRQHEH